jgi:hypothetical protein
MLQKKASKNKLLILLTIYFFSISLESKMFLGKIIFPEKLLPTVRLYYNGKNLLPDIDPKKQYRTVPFSIDDDASLQSLNILICPHVCCASENNNITDLRVSAGKPYTFYSLEATRKLNRAHQEVLSWNYSQKRLEKNIIPINTIIFLFDPRLVKGLDVPYWNKESQIRLLPGIKMNKASLEDFTREMDRAYLAGMDIDFCHSRAETTIAQNNQTIVKLPKLHHS